MKNYTKTLTLVILSVLAASIAGLAPAFAGELEWGADDSAQNVETRNLQAETSPPNGSFESGDLAGYTASGSVTVTRSVGPVWPTAGEWMALLSTSPDDGPQPANTSASSLSVQFQVPAGATHLRFDADFMTAELDPSFANDYFVATLISPTGQIELYRASTLSPSSYFLAPGPYSSHTGWISTTYPISAAAGSGQNYTLRFELSDFGDGRVDSAAALDNILLFVDADGDTYPAAGTYGDNRDDCNDTDSAINPGQAEIPFDGIDNDCNAFTPDGPDLLISALDTSRVEIDAALSVSGVITAQVHNPTVDIMGGAFKVVFFEDSNASGDFEPALDQLLGVGMHAGSIAPRSDAWVAATLSGTLALAYHPIYAKADTDPITGLGAIVERNERNNLHHTARAKESGPVYAAAIDDEARSYYAFSRGDGSFDALNYLGDLGHYARGAAVADLDGDGDLDLVVGHSYNSYLAWLYWYEWTASGFAAPRQLATVGSGNRLASSWLMDLAAGDFDGDGDVDVVANTDRQYSWLWRNPGDQKTGRLIYTASFESDSEGWTAGGGTAIEHASHLAYHGGYAMRVYAIAANSSLNARIELANWRLDGGSEMSLAYRIPPGTPVGLHVYVDERGNWICLGGTPAHEHAGYAYNDAYTLVDDGAWHELTIDVAGAIRQVWPDAVTVSDLRWWTDSNANAGAEFWFDELRITSASPVELLADTGSGQGRGVDAADFDEDGDLDLAWARYSDGYLYLYRNDGQAHFTPVYLADVGSDPYGVAAADFDGDGHADIIANAGSSGDASFLKGDGCGSFEAPLAIPSLDFNDYGAWDNWDFDGDGRQDLVAVDNTGRGVWYYPGLGDGSFGARAAIGRANTTSLGVAAPARPDPQFPTALILPAQQSVAVSGTAFLDGSVSYDRQGRIVTATWDFGDSSPILTATSPLTTTHVYTAEGVYTVRLKVWDDSAPARGHTGLAQVRVLGTPPQADAGGPYVFSETAAYAGAWLARLDGSGSTDAETGIVSYEWNFVDPWGFENPKGLGISPTHVYSTPGVYTVVLTVTDGAGQTGVDTTTVTIQAGAPPQADAGGPYTFDEGVANAGQWLARLSGISSTDDSGVYGYRWNFFPLSPWERDGMRENGYTLTWDFDDGQAAGWTATSGSWGVVSGTYVQTSTAQPARTIVNATNLVDYDYRLRAARTAGTDGLFISFIYQAKPVLWTIGGGSNTYSRLEGISINSETQTTDTLTLDQWVEVRIQVDGARAAGWLNGVKRWDIVRYPDGVSGDSRVSGLGLATWNAQAAFDDVSLVVYPASELFPTSSPTATHRYTAPGVYTATLSVYDHALQESRDMAVVTVTGNALPVASAGGPYDLGEAAAWGGAWLAALTTTGSTDDVGLFRYEWDFGDRMTSTVLEAGTYASRTSQPGFADDFDDGLPDGWTLTGGNWHVIDGELRQLNRSSYWYWAQDLSRVYRDFSFEVDVLGENSGYLGFVFRHPNTAASQGGFLVYAHTSWNEWQLHDWGNTTLLTRGGSGWQPGRWYHVQIVAEGETIRMYLDGVLQLQVDDWHYPSGGIGLLTNGTAARFDNVRVTPITGGAAPLHLYTIDSRVPWQAPEERPYSAPLTHTVTVTAYDHALQSDTAAATLVAHGDGLPVADAGGPYVIGCESATSGVWRAAFDGSGSSDDHGLYRYVWELYGTSPLAGGTEGGAALTESVVITRNTGTPHATPFAAAATELYGYDIPDASLRVLATQADTHVQIVDISDGRVLKEKDLARYELWTEAAPGNATYFKVQADRPVLAYLSDNTGGHSAFVPSLHSGPVGQEFIFYHGYQATTNEGLYVFAVQDSLVRFYDNADKLVYQAWLAAGQYRKSPLAYNAVYHVVSTGRIALQFSGGTSLAAVPDVAGDGAGRTFYFASEGGLRAFAYQDADLRVFDLDTGIQLYTQTLQAGKTWSQASLGPRRLRLESSGEVSVWSGADSFQDDLTMAGGRGGREFILDSLDGGAVLFAPYDGTRVDVSGTTFELERDDYLYIPPQATWFISATEPVIIQVMGRSSGWSSEGSYLGGVERVERSYTAPGVYTATLTVYDHALQTARDTTVVSVTAGTPPTADANGPYTIEVGAELRLNGYASTDELGVVDYTWDFGDGGLPSDDWDDGNAEGWIVVDPSSLGAPSAWQVVNGQYVQSSTIYGYNPSLASTFAYLTGTWGSDYAFSVRLKSTDNDGIGVMFRVADEDSYYRFGWWAEGRVGRYLDRVVDGHLATLYADDTPYLPNVWYTIKIVAQASSLRVYQDGQLIIHVLDDKIPAGRIALYSYANQNSVFDELKGDGLGDGPAPLHAYLSPGVYTPTLTVMDDCLLTDTQTAVVTALLGLPPTAAAGGPYTNEALTVTFDGSGSTDDYGILAYRWDFGHELSATLWAQTAWASSHMCYQGWQWCDYQATGAPTVSACSHNNAAWASSSPDMGEQWLELLYDRPLTPSAVTVRESYNPGFVTGLVLYDTEGLTHTLSVTDTTAQCPGDLIIPIVDADYQTQRVRLIVDTNVAGWNEIDAVSLSGLEQAVETADPWGFGNPKGLSHAFPAPGVYSVRLNVYDHAGQVATDTTTASVRVGNPPVANAGGPYLQEPTTFHFDGSGSTDDYGIARYEWDFGDGFADDFRGDDSAWTPVAGTWGVSGGSYQQSDAALDRTTNLAGPVIDDLAASADVRLLSGAGEEAQLVFRAVDANNKYELLLRGREYDDVTLYRVTNGASTALAQASLGWNVLTNTSYHLQVEAFGTNLRGYLDGQLVVEANDAAFGRGRCGLSTFQTAAAFDNVRFDWRARGAQVEHTYASTGTYTVTLTVTDYAGQSDTDVTRASNVATGRPIASAGGPYWGGLGGPPVYFDGSGSSDDDRIARYEWDLGTALADSFDGGVIDSSRWFSAGVVQSETVTVTGNNGWGYRYLFSRDAFTRSESSLVAQAQIKLPASGGGAFGFNDGSVSYSINNMPHALHFDSGVIYVHERTYDRGQVGSFQPGLWYDVKVEALPLYGALYWIKPLTATGWTLLYHSTSYTDRQMRAGYTAYSGEHVLDNVRVYYAGSQAHPVHTYGVTGTFPVTLTVYDAYGQSASDTTLVTIDENAPPRPICVPLLSGDPLAPHETYNGHATTLKAVVEDRDPLTYTWAFGDGTSSAVLTATNPADLSVRHFYPPEEDGTPFTARLTVWDSLGQSGSCKYRVRVRDRKLDVEANVAIDDALWWLYRQQATDGYWVSGGYRASPTASAVQAFEINGHLENGDPAIDPYVRVVERGLTYLFRTQLKTIPIGPQPAGDPDTNGNGIGIGTASTGVEAYETGMVMMALAASNAPRETARCGPAGIAGRSYFELLTDMVDLVAWGQSNTGGWRYSWNSSDADNSVSQWPALGLEAAETAFGIHVPEWVKTENLRWLAASQNATSGSFGYISSGDPTHSTTPSGLVQLAFDGVPSDDPRHIAAQNWILRNNHYCWKYRCIVGSSETGLLLLDMPDAGINFYGLYAMAKAARTARPEPLVLLGTDTPLNWYADPEYGLVRYLADRQEPDGSWVADATYTHLGPAWMIVVLARTLYRVGVVADAGPDRHFGPGWPLLFDGSGSYHLDPFRDIISYEWDYDGDGKYDSQDSQPTALHTYNELGTYQAALRVTDNNLPPITHVDTAEIEITLGPHPPLAYAGGPYKWFTGSPLMLDGSQSYEIDEGDSIVRYGWELDGIYPYDFNDAFGAVVTWTWDMEDVYDIGLKVWDNGGLNDLDKDGMVDEFERKTDVQWTRVTIKGNHTPTANADGPYTGLEGTPLALDGSGSYDPDGPLALWRWDTDNDGAYNDRVSGQAVTLHTWYDDYDGPLGLQVVDRAGPQAGGVATDTTWATIRNVSPTVELGPDLGIPPGWPLGLRGELSDPGTLDTHELAWDYGDMTTQTVTDSGTVASWSVTSTHSYATEGIYTVTLTVSDDDGGVGQDSIRVRVKDGPDLQLAKTVTPTAVASGDVVSFTLSYTNAGSIAAQNVVLTDTLPAGLQIANSKSQIANWDLGTVTAGSSGVVVLTATVAPTSATYAVFTNTAVIATGTPDELNPWDNTAEARLTLGQAVYADLTLSKTVTPTAVASGEVVTYTLTYANRGLIPAENVVLTDTLPGGLRNTQYTNPRSAAEWDAIHTNRIITWDLGTLPADTAGSLVLTATVELTTAAHVVFTNTAVISTSTFEFSTGNNESYAVNELAQGADLALSKDVDRAAPDEGEQIIYTLRVSNNGPAAASGVTISDVLPGGVSYTADDGGGSYNPASGAWQVGSLDLGASLSLHITASVETGTAGTVITNTATLLAATPADPVASNNQASASIVVPSPAGADLALSKTVHAASPVIYQPFQLYLPMVIRGASSSYVPMPPQTRTIDVHAAGTTAQQVNANQGTLIVYTLVATNAGPAPASGVVISDRLPAGMSYESDDGGGAYEHASGAWQVGELGVGVSVTLRITVTVDRGTLGWTITNTAVISQADQLDPLAANNQASALVIVRPGIYYRFRLYLPLMLRYYEE
ncbi:MAG: DUF11 domain-containing protein [Thermoflexales bacterium]|nr:DUF11 domain-containing protein [Thermoflexales bacterium]